MRRCHRWGLVVVRRDNFCLPFGGRRYDLGPVYNSRDVVQSWRVGHVLDSIIEQDDSLEHARLPGPLAASVVVDRTFDIRVFDEGAQCGPLGAVLGNDGLTKGLPVRGSQ